MPAELGPGRTLAETVAVAPSAIAELVFSFFACRKREIQSPMFRVPAWMTPEISEASNRVYRRMLDVWADVPAAEFSEALVLAQHTHTILDDNLDQFFARFEEACARPTPRNLMPMEPQELRDAIARRLDILRESPTARDEYRGILRDQWEILRPQWDATGLPAVRRAGQETRRALERASDLRQVVPANHLARKEAFWPHIERALRESEVAISPMYFAGEGQLLADLPGLMLLGVGLDVGEKEERRRAEAALSARKFKLLSDPTRVAILSTMLRHPISITDLAERYELSQPTVSVHVKALREAGLLDAEKSGNSTLYRASEERLRAMIGEAVDCVVSDAGLNC